MQNTTKSLTTLQSNNCSYHACVVEASTNLVERRNMVSMESVRVSSIKTRNPPETPSPTTYDAQQPVSLPQIRGTGPFVGRLRLEGKLSVK
jgi:hypothetical protein